MVPFDVADSRLSAISLAALEDQGYHVNYEAADPLSKTDLGSSCQCSTARRRIGEEEEDYKPPQKRKLLSDAGQEKAIKAGQTFLEGWKMPSMEGGDDIDDTGFVGGNGVFVYYEENGHVHTVYAQRA